MIAPTPGKVGGWGGRLIQVTFCTCTSKMESSRSQWPARFLLGWGRVLPYGNQYLNVLDSVSTQRLSMSSPTSPSFCRSWKVARAWVLSNATQAEGMSGIYFWAWHPCLPQLSLVLQWFGGHMSRQCGCKKEERVWWSPELRTFMPSCCKSDVCGFITARSGLPEYIFLCVFILYCLFLLVGSKPTRFVYAYIPNDCLIPSRCSKIFAEWINESFHQLRRSSWYDIFIFIFHSLRT